MNSGLKTDFKNVIGRISVEKLHLCEPGLSSLLPTVVFFHELKTFLSRQTPIIL